MHLHQELALAAALRLTHSVGIGGLGDEEVGPQRRRQVRRAKVPVGSRVEVARVQDRDAWCSFV